MCQSQAILDPNDLYGTAQRLNVALEIPAETAAALGPVIALLPRSVILRSSPAALPSDQSLLSDHFTFDLDRDELLVFDLEPETLIDAVVEMAMYLTGFSTMLGNEETWIVEFTIGAWKPVKNRIRQQVNLPANIRPRAIVGLPSPSLSEEPGSFANLVANYDLLSFHQMVMLAARDDVTVHFPENTHPQVLAVYVYMRRAMQEVSRDLDLSDYQTFNSRLLEEIQRLQSIFKPSTLSLPDWVHDAGLWQDDTTPERATRLDSVAGQAESRPAGPDNPFEAFIDELFPDDPEDDQPRS